MANLKAKKEVVLKVKSSDMNSINVKHSDALNIPQKKKSKSVDNGPLMPISTAVWLVDNTSLTFQQIAEFCKLTEVEVSAIADGEIAVNVRGENPILNGQLSQEEIELCQKDKNRKMEMLYSEGDRIISKFKEKKYVSVASRQYILNAILYLVIYHPTIKNVQIRKMIPTTNKTIDSIRNKTHPEINELEPKDPVAYGVCSQEMFQKIVG